MRHFLKIMSVLVAVLAVLTISLLVVAIFIWDVNLLVVLSEVVPEYEDGMLTQDNLGAYLSVLTGIVALLFPISLSIISDAKGKYFNSEEVTTIVFNHWTYKALKWILGFLTMLTVISFFKNIHLVLLILVLFAVTISLIFLFFFFNRLEKVIQDFSMLVREREKSAINKLLGNGQN